MRILQLFGIGENRLFAQGVSVIGHVTGVKKCWWLKVNTKPVRTSMWDGAKFPHIAEFSYEADGKACMGRRWVSYRETPPAVGKAVRVYYDSREPQKYAVKL